LLVLFLGGFLVVMSTLLFLWNYSSISKDSAIGKIVAQPETHLNMFMRTGKFSLLLLTDHNIY